METIELNTMKWKQIIYINYIKTIWFNFWYLPLDEAVRFPVLLARKVKIRHCHRSSFMSLKGMLNLAHYVLALVIVKQI